MKAMREMAVISIALAAVMARGQSPSTNAPPAPDGKAERKWSFGASLYSYFVPDDREYVQPTISADRDWLHLEARYNYEGLETGSA